jgi:hypothetical protein
MRLFYLSATGCYAPTESGGIEIKLQLAIQLHDRTLKLSELHATSVTYIRGCMTVARAKVWRILRYCRNLLIASARSNNDGDNNINITAIIVKIVNRY